MLKQTAALIIATLPLASIADICVPKGPCGSGGDYPLKLEIVSADLFNLEAVPLRPDKLYAIKITVKHIGENVVYTKGNARTTLLGNDEVAMLGTTKPVDYTYTFSARLREPTNPSFTLTPFNIQTVTREPDLATSEIMFAKDQEVTFTIPLKTNFVPTGNSEIWSYVDIKMNVRKEGSKAQSIYHLATAEVAFVPAPASPGDGGGGTGGGGASAPTVIVVKDASKQLRPGNKSPPTLVPTVSAPSSCVSYFSC